MKIAFFWTWEFSKNILKWILENNEIEIPIVLSQPDKPVWRKKILQQTPIKILALENKIEIEQPKTFKKNEEIIELLINLKLDFIIVVAYWKIIPKEILEIPKYACINLHGSILPKYRWASPIQESIKQWDKETWLTVMYMNEAMDEWDILKIEKTPIDKDDKTEDIFKKFEKIWPKLLQNTLKEVYQWKIEWTPQKHSEATYCSKISKLDWQIDFSKDSSNQIYNKFRAYNTWPEIYSFYNDKKIIIKDCEIYEDLDYKTEQKIWTVVKINKKTIWVICYDNKILLLRQVQLEGKKTTDILSFVNWNQDFLKYKF